MDIERRVASPAVALETTLVVHGVPRRAAMPLVDQLESAVIDAGAHPAFVGVVSGRPIVGLSRGEVEQMLDAPDVPKANTSNLGVLMYKKHHAATTVSTTMEIAAGAGLRVFATGGLGGVHRGYGQRLDISSDLAALARTPMVVVCSGVKSILDVASTREMLETLGVTVVGYRTDSFPAFYLREGGVCVDIRMDDVREIAAFATHELTRTGRAIVVANPVPMDHEISPQDWDGYMLRAIAQIAQRETVGLDAHGRHATPALLAALHEVSGGRTLRANIALAASNADLAGTVASAMHHAV